MIDKVSDVGVRGCAVLFGVLGCDLFVYIANCDEIVNVFEFGDNGEMCAATASSCD